MCTSAATKLAKHDCVHW